MPAEQDADGVRAGVGGDDADDDDQDPEPAVVRREQERHEHAHQRDVGDDERARRDVADESLGAAEEPRGQRGEHGRGEADGGEADGGDVQVDAPGDVAAEDADDGPDHDGHDLRAHALEQQRPVHLDGGEAEPDSDEGVKNHGAQISPAASGTNRATPTPMATGRFRPAFGVGLAVVL